MPIRNTMSVLSKNLKVALLQFHAGADKKANLQKVKEFASKAITQHPSLDLLVLPECFNSPYSVEEFKNYCEPIPGGETTEFLSNLAKEHKVSIVGGSFPELGSDNKIYNTSLTFDKTGKIIAKHRKVHLFDIDIPGKMTFKESISLAPGDKATVFQLEDFCKVGLGICYDIRFPELAMVAARQGAGIMFYPGAFNTVTGPKFWTKFAVARAIDNQVYVVMCSPARNVAGGGYQAYGHSMVVDPNGDVLVEAGHDEDIVYCELKPDVITEARKNIPISTQRRFDVYHDVASDAVAKDI
ncbi:hypothetical protein OGAPHI_004206 [Ogataea philodendri]|uniref:CN hydrolase domain-containing protein n=1 Tax=Ogataea philodendri TaxID=1378263 RepID=A0A9P8P686_9ASCO|nr:uncharacterized protein OGAPHI_004206 [Ogataea philodendri]KAH3666017.1 hypothetical protein OGAPHI_004206 [Ogataea philodendri]